MTINGNYDAGRVSNPFYGAGTTGGVPHSDKIEVFPSGVQNTDGNPWGVNFTSTATTETRAAGVVVTVGKVFEEMTTEDDAYVTGFFADYVKGDPTKTAFNIANSNVWGIFNPDNLV